MKKPVHSVYSDRQLISFYCHIKLLHLDLELTNKSNPRIITLSSQACKVGNVKHTVLITAGINNWRLLPFLHS